MTDKKLPDIINEIERLGYVLEHMTLINPEEQIDKKLSLSVSCLHVYDNKLQKDLIDHLDKGKINLGLTPIAVEITFTKKGVDPAYDVVICPKTKNVWYLLGGQRPEDISKIFKDYGWNIKIAETNIPNYLY